MLDDLLVDAVPPNFLPFHLRIRPPPANNWWYGRAIARWYLDPERDAYENGPIFPRVCQSTPPPPRRACLGYNSEKAYIPADEVHRLVWREALTHTRNIWINVDVASENLSRRSVNPILSARSR